MTTKIKNKESLKLSKMEKNLTDLVVDSAVTIKNSILEINKKDIEKIKNDLSIELEELKEKIFKEKIIEIKINNTFKELKGEILHRQFSKVLSVIAQELNCLIIGPAGSGKTQMAEQIAKTLDLEFYTISVGEQTTQSNILGFVDAMGNYKPTEFRKAFENGGLFLLDEMDAGNPNVLTVLNSALANGFCTFPDGKIRKHSNFKLIASANTFGNGQNGDYVGRNQLDAATLDRFVKIVIEYDEEMESELINNIKWFNLYKKFREFAKERKFKAIFSTRKLLAGEKLINIEWSYNEIIEAFWSGSLKDGELEDLKSLVTN